MAVAKFAAQYKKDGMLFISLYPSIVDVGSHYQNRRSTLPLGTNPTTNNSILATPEQLERVGALMQKFAVYAPIFKSPGTPEQSVTALRKVINEAIEKDNSGEFLPHFGNKTWLG